GKLPVLLEECKRDPKGHHRERQPYGFLENSVESLQVTPSRRKKQTADICTPEPSHHHHQAWPRSNSNPKQQEYGQGKQQGWVDPELEAQHQLYPVAYRDQQQRQHKKKATASHWIHPLIRPFKAAQWQLAE